METVDRNAPAKSSRQVGRYLIWMAWRALVGRRRKTGVSFMTTVSISGVSIGVAALIVVLSVMGGFADALREKMLRGQPHLEIVSPVAAAGFPLIETPLSRIAEAFPEATGIEPFTQADVVLKRRKHVAAATLFGIDPAKGGRLWGFGDAVTFGSFSTLTENHLPVNGVEGDQEFPGIVLGEELASHLGADLGDPIVVLSPQTSVTSALASGTVSRTYVISGLFRTEMFNYDAKWAVVSLAEGRRFLPAYDPSLDAEEWVSGVALNVPDPLAMDGMVARVKELGDFAPLTWQMTNRSLLFALKLEKFAMGFILMLIVVVAAFSISGTLMMMVYHRRSQVALLRAIGMAQGHVTGLFLAQGLVIGTVGVVLGTVGGVLVCFLIGLLKFVPLPQDIYYLRSMPVTYLPLDYAVIGMVALILTLVAAVYPALTAARQDPSVGLRCE